MKKIIALLAVAIVSSYSVNATSVVAQGYSSYGNSTYVVTPGSTVAEVDLHGVGLAYVVNTSTGQRIQLSSPSNGHITAYWGSGNYYLSASIFGAPTWSRAEAKLNY